MNYKQKYFTYKKKYLNLKQHGYGLTDLEYKIVNQDKKEEYILFNNVDDMLKLELELNNIIMMMRKKDTTNFNSSDIQILTEVGDFLYYKKDKKIEVNDNIYNLIKNTYEGKPIDITPVIVSESIISKICSLLQIKKTDKIEEIEEIEEIKNFNVSYENYNFNYVNKIFNNWNKKYKVLSNKNILIKSSSEQFSQILDYHLNLYNLLYRLLKSGEIKEVNIVNPAMHDKLTSNKDENNINPNIFYLNYPANISSVSSIIDNIKNGNLPLFRYFSLLRNGNGTFSKKIIKTFEEYIKFHNSNIPG
jgi:hypothetical protein